MVPLCLECQATVSSEITTRDVLTRQQSLTGTIEAMIDANHKACSASKNIDFKIETVQGACEGIVTLLSDMQQQLDRLDKKIDDSALNLYNKVSTFFDESAPVDNADTVAKIETLTSATYKIGEGQGVIDERLKVINQGLISLSERDHGPAVAEILEEIKAISVNLP